jgi:hypothetical protein
MIETYLNKGGVSHSLSPAIAEKEISGVLPLQAVREFIGTYNRHFLTNYAAEEFVVGDELNEGEYERLQKQRPALDAAIKKHMAKHHITKADINKKVPYNVYMKFPGKTPSDKIDNAYKARNLKLYGTEKGVDAAGHAWTLPGYGRG